VSVAQGRSEIRDLLKRHGLRPRKRLGQHFLADPNLVERIVREAAVGPGDRVVEIGAGTGTLSKALAATGARVVAYEIDEGLRPLLEESLAESTVEVRFADALTVDLSTELGDGEWILVANLPYNVGTPLLLEILRGAPNIVRFVVMLQREVADRLVADPGTSAYGLPSVGAALRAEVRFGFAVSPQVFLPPPDVGSAVVTLVRRQAPPGADLAERLAAVAFNQRRKMLRRSLAQRLGDPEGVLLAAGIDPTARPEELGVGRWLDLAAVVAAREDS